MEDWERHPQTLGRRLAAPSSDGLQAVTFTPVRGLNRQCPTGKVPLHGVIGVEALLCRNATLALL